MTLFRRLGLGFVVTAPIAFGLVYNHCFDLNLFNSFLFLIVSMGFCGAFSSLLHFMLPRKRPVQEGDSSDGENLLKKHCVGCFISSSESSTGKSTATEANTTPKDCNKSDSSVIGSSSSNLSSASIRVLPDMAFGNGNPMDIDEDLHSRQLAVYGRETMRRLFASNVLVSGMQGLGVEIAKNLVLAGVKSVTLHDEGTVELWDLSSNFIFSENDVGKNRALASVQKLQELNNAVAISTLTSKLMKEQLSDFQKMQTLHVHPPVTQPPGQSSGSIQMLRAESSSSSIDDDELSPAQIHEIQMNFQEPSSVNKLHTYSSTRPALLPPTRNYYARPTPPDVLYEETYLNDQGSYHGKTIYEWNIDGETEYGIYKKLHQMLMYATVCRQYSNQDQAIAKFIINGFTGLLKGWWDHVLTLTQQLEILNSVKLEVDPTTNQPVQ